MVFICLIVDRVPFIPQIFFQDIGRKKTVMVIVLHYILDIAFKRTLVIYGFHQRDDNRNPGKMRCRYILYDSCNHFRKRGFMSFTKMITSVMVLNTGIAGDRYQVRGVGRSEEHTSEL